MEPFFSHREYFPGLYHITDGLGVQFTLIVPGGGEGALLFDTGYGFADPRPYIGGLLEKHGLGSIAPRVVISHAHYDHLPGARWFDSFYIHHDDIPVMETYTEKKFRLRILAQARERRILPADFDEAAFFNADYRSRVRPEPPAIPGLDLLPIPGHTPGSLVLYVREHRLILCADNWNPTTWLFFPEALPVMDYAANMRRLLSLDFDHVLCSHSRALIPAGRFRSFIQGLTGETFARAVPAETPYPEIETLGCRPEPGTSLVFRRPRPI